MTKVTQRLRRIPGQRTRRRAWGYTAQIVENGQRKQKRCYKAGRTRDDAEKELAALLLKVEQQPKAPVPSLTLAQARGAVPRGQSPQAVAPRRHSPSETSHGVLREGHAPFRDHFQPNR